jgi:hypothetical protein
MKLRRFFVILLGATFLLAGSLAAAQSLGDLARKQREEREKLTQKPAKVLTNEDVATTKTSEGPTAAAGMSEEPQTPGEETASVPPETSSKPPEAAQSGEESAAEKMKTQEYWQGAFKAAKAKIAAAEEVQRLSEDELGLLQLQRARELSSTTQAELDASIQSKSAEVDSKRADTTKAKQALDNLQKEFDDSGAPADWAKTD